MERIKIKLDRTFNTAFQERMNTQKYQKFNHFFEVASKVAWRPKWKTSGNEKRKTTLQGKAKDFDVLWLSGIE